MAYRLLRTSQLSGVPGYYALSGKDFFHTTIGTGGSPWSLGSGALSSVKVTYNEVTEWMGSAATYDTVQGGSNTHSIWLSAGDGTDRAIYIPHNLRTVVIGGNVSGPGDHHPDTFDGAARLSISGGVSASDGLSAAGFNNDPSYFGSWVGIGTNKPNGLLHLSSADSPEAISISDTTNDRTTTIGQGDSYTNVFGDAANTGMQLGFGAPSPGNSKVTILQSGYVGIGAGTTPNAPLHFAQTHTGELLRLDDSASAGSPYISFYQNGTARGKFQYYDTTDSSRTHDEILIENPYGAINLRPGASNIPVVGLYVAHDGEVGIGTTAPTSPFHVYGPENGAAHFESTDTNAFIVIGDSNDSLYISSDNGIGSLGGTSGAHANNLNLDLTSGNVGIGSNAPGRLLHVGKSHEDADEGLLRLKNDSDHSDADCYIEFIAGTNQSWSCGIDSSTDAFTISESNAISTNKYFVVEEGGNVGIGTESPLKLLHIQDASTAHLLIDSKSTTNDTLAALLFRTEDQATAVRIKGGVIYEKKSTYGRGTLHLVNDTVGDADNCAISDSKLSIDTSGIVSVHHTGPSAIVGGNAAFVVNSRAANSNGITLINGSDKMIARLMEHSSGHGLLSLRDGDVNKVSINATGDSYLVGGDVGIGTNDPDAKLHVQSENSQEPQVYIENVNDDGLGAELRFVKTTATPLAGDILGQIMFMGTETSDPQTTRHAASIRAINKKVDSGYVDGSLIFSCAHSNNNNERMRITGSDDGVRSQVGIGTEALPGWKGYDILQVGDGSLGNYPNTADTRLSSNAYAYASGWKRIYGAEMGAAQITVTGTTDPGANIQLKVAATDDTDTAITWVEGLKVSYDTGASNNTKTLVSGDLEITGNTTHQGDVLFNGTITLGDADSDNVVFKADVDSNIVPDDDSTYTIGTATKQWLNIHSDEANIDKLTVDYLVLDGLKITTAGKDPAADLELGSQSGTIKIVASNDLDLTDGDVKNVDKLYIKELHGSTASSANGNMQIKMTNSLTAALAISDGTDTYMTFDTENDLIHLGEVLKTSKQINSTVSEGTAPFVVASTIKVTNLNADELDGYHAGNANGNVPINNSTKNTNLNADMLDGYHADVENSNGYVPFVDTSGKLHIHSPASGTGSGTTWTGINIGADNETSFNAVVSLRGSYPALHMMDTNDFPSGDMTIYRAGGDGSSGNYICHGWKYHDKTVGVDQLQMRIHRHGNLSIGDHTADPRGGAMLMVKSGLVPNAGSDGGSGVHMGMGEYSHFGSRYSSWDTWMGTNVHPSDVTNSNLILATSFIGSGAAAVRVGWGDASGHDRFAVYGWTEADLTGKSAGSEIALPSPDLAVDYQGKVHMGTVNIDGGTIDNCTLNSCIIGTTNANSGYFEKIYFTEGYTEVYSTVDSMQHTQDGVTKKYTDWSGVNKAADVDDRHINVGGATDGNGAFFDITGSVGINNILPDRYHSKSNDLVIGRHDAVGDSHGMTIASGSQGSGSIYFADSWDESSDTSVEWRGFIEYQHASTNKDYLRIGVAGNDAMRILSDTSTGSKHFLGIGKIDPTFAVDIKGDTLCISNNTNTTTGGEGNARILFNEQNYGNYGFSIAYAGVVSDGGISLDGNILPTPTNTLSFFRHDNSRTGAQVLSMDREDGEVKVHTYLTVDNLLLNGAQLESTGANSLDLKSGGSGKGIYLYPTGNSSHVRVRGASQTQSSLLVNYANNSDNYSAALAWNSLQLGNNGQNKIVAGDRNAGAYFDFFVNNTNRVNQSSHAPNGTKAMTIKADGTTWMKNVDIDGATSSFDGQYVTTNGGYIRATNTNANGNGLIYIEGKGHAILEMKSDTDSNDSLYDSLIHMNNGASGHEWSMGLNSSANHRFELCNSNSLGTNTIFYVNSNSASTWAAQDIYFPHTVSIEKLLVDSMTFNGDTISTVSNKPLSLTPGNNTLNLNTNATVQCEGHNSAYFELGKTSGSQSCYLQFVYGDGSNSYTQLVNRPGTGYVRIFESGPTVKLNKNVEAIGEITAFVSDRRLKKNIKDIPNALAKVNKIRGVTFNFNAAAKKFGFDEDSQKVGVLADEIEAVLPEAVRKAPFDAEYDSHLGDYTSKSGEDYKTVKYEQIVPLLIEAIKDLSGQVENLTEKVNTLEGKR